MYYFVAIRHGATKKVSKNKVTILIPTKIAIVYQYQ
jgi:hypothetical protein